MRTVNTLEFLKHELNGGKKSSMEIKNGMRRISGSLKKWGGM
jgi:hypothetical protein